MSYRRRNPAPLELFSETTCLPTWGKLDRLSDFLRQSFTFLGEIVPLERFFTDDLFHPFKYYFKKTQSVH